MAESSSKETARHHDTGRGDTLAHYSQSMREYTMHLYAEALKLAEEKAPSQAEAVPAAVNPSGHGE